MPLPRDASNIRKDDVAPAAAWNGILAWTGSEHAGIANVRTFGARGDGTDDTAAIRAAIAALTSGGKLVFPPGTYLLSGEVAGRSNIELVGYGATITSATRMRSYFYFEACTKVVVRGLTFDCGQPVLPTYAAHDYPNNYNQAIYAFQSADIEVLDCAFRNLYTQGMFFFQCSGKLSLLRNTHTSPVQAQKVNLQHVGIQTSSSDVTIDDCDFDNAATTTAFGVAGVFASGTTGSLRCVNSRFNYCGRNSVGGHQLGAFSCYGDDINVTVAHNVFTNCLQQVVRLTSTHNAEVFDNSFTMAAAAGDGDQIISIEGTYAFFRGLVGCRNIKVHHNTFVDGFATTRIGVYASAYDYAIPLEDIMIHDNTFVNMKKAVIVAGPYTGVHVENNVMRGANGGSIAYTADPGGVPATAEHGVNEVDSVCKDLRITGNVFDLDRSGAIPIMLSFLTDHAYTGTIGAIDVSNNTARMAGEAATQFFGYRGIPGQGRLTLRGNSPDNYTYAFDIANVAQLIVEDNKIRNIAAANFVLAGGAIGSRLIRSNIRETPAGPTAIVVQPPD